MLFKDEDFLRDEVPMSKEEVRACSLLKLGIKNDDICLDIGAGSGSITIAIASAAHNGLVYSIECKDKAIELIKKNIDKFNLNNINLIKGFAPENLPDIKFDKIFVGGSSGKLSQIFDYIDKNLKKNGVLVLNFIVIENMAIAIDELKNRKYKNIEIVNLSISRNRLIGEKNMMIGENPIYIIRAEKNNG